MISIVIPPLRTLAFVLLGAAVAACAAVEPEPEPAPLSDGPLVVRDADPIRGIQATWDDGVEHLELRAWIDPMGNVHSTIADRGRVATRFDVPLAGARDVADQIGPRAREIAWSRVIATPTPDDEHRLIQLMPIYERALTSLYRLTEPLGDGSLRMALPWHEEVLARMVVGAAVDLDADTACADEGPVHTNLVHRPEMLALRKQAAQDPGGGPALAGDTIEQVAACDLNCSWYDVCCHHDEACVACDHWWCGWACTTGCSGGDCGGGR